MKKLKLQKVLLAICLALPITLKMTNETNAMKNKEETNLQIPNNNDSNEPTNKQETFLQTLDDYLRERKGQGRPLTKLQYRQLLRKYIGDDIVKLLALKIQAKYEQITTDENLDDTELISISKLCDEIDKYPPIYPQGEHLKPNNSQEDPISKIHKETLYLVDYAYPAPTKEIEILDLLLFKYIPPCLDTPKELLNQLGDTINAYKNDQNKPVDQKHSLLLSFLGPVAKQLTQESSYLKSIRKEQPRLEQLANLVSDFSAAYNDKLKKLPQPTQQQIKKGEEEAREYDGQETTKRIKIEQNSNYTEPKQTKTYKDTYSYNIVETLRELKVTQPLTVKQHKAFLRNYIGGDITKYLAFMLQVYWDQLPTYYPPDDTELIDPTSQYYFTDIIDYITLYYALLDELDNPTIEHPGEHIITTNGKQEQYSNVLQEINKLYQQAEQEHEGKEQTKEEEILYLIFNCDYHSYPQYDLKQLKDKITAYTNIHNTTVDQSYSTLISFLSTVADQLILENSYLSNNNKDTQNELLARLANQMKAFSDAYKSKLEKQKIEQEEADRKKKEEAVDIDIKQIKQLIRKWITQKGKINKEKEAKLKKLEQAIKATELKYNKIVKGKKVKRKQI